MNLKKEVNDLFLLFGPMGLVISLGLYFYPNFDDFDVPQSRDELTPLVGFVTDVYTMSHKGNTNYFIKVETSDDLVTLKAMNCCLEWLKGKRIETLIYPDFMGRWFDIAWDLKIDDGKQVYSYEEERRKYINHLPYRKSIGKWGIIIGVFVTPLWYLRRRRIA